MSEVVCLFKFSSRVTHVLEDMLFWSLSPQVFTSCLQVWCLLSLMKLRWWGNSQQTHKEDYNKTVLSLAEWVQKEGFPGGGDTQHLQQQAMADLRTLAALQREHVLFRGREGDLRPQTHELPGTLVRPSFPHILSCFHAWF